MIQELSQAKNTYNPLKTFMQSQKNHCKVTTGPTSMILMGRLLVNKFTSPISFTACKSKEKEFTLCEPQQAHTPFELKIGNMSHHFNGVGFLVVQRSDDIISWIRYKTTNCSSCISCYTCYTELSSFRTIFFSPFENIRVHEIHGMLKC